MHKSAEQLDNELARAQAQIAELKRSVRTYQALVEYAKCGIVVGAANGSTIEMANPAIAAMHGYTVDEATHLSVADLFAPECRDEIVGHLGIADTERHHVWESRHVRKDGTTFPVLVEVTAVHDESGVVLRRIIHVHDIAGHKLVEETLRESEEKYRSLAESSSDYIMRYDRQCRHSYMNAAGLRVSGMAAADLIGKTHRESGFPEELCHLWEERIMQVFETAEPSQIEFEWTGADGSVVLDLRLTPEFDADGKVRSVLGVSRDITERKLMEEALRASEQRYALTLAAVDDGLWDWHVPTGKAVFSSIYYAMLGYDDGEFPASYGAWRQVVHPEDIDRVERDLRTSVERDTGFAIDLRMKTKSGAWRWVCTRGKAVERDAQGKALRMVGTLSNITDRKQAEEETAKLQAQLQQAQKMESVGRLAGGVAHDFNNMLAVILGNVAIAMDQVDPAQPLHADLREIQTAAERSADLTRQLLAFARKQVVAPKVLNLNDTVESMLKMLRRLIGEHIHLVWLPDATLWPVHVDPSQIDQLLANLCVNARDAIGGVGKLSIETGNCNFDADYLATHEGVVPGDYVRLAIGDDGCGMAKETQAHLFEPFFTTKAMGQGTGLGLATVYGIVKQNHGYIHVDSEPGQGTTFTIYLPRHVATNEAAQSIAPAGAVAPRGHETVLLVEDEPAILKMIARMLEKQGYSVLPAGSPSAALRLAQDHAGEVHLLMTDVVMPEMNGRDLALNVKALHPGLKQLFMSGYTANVIADHSVLEDGMHFIQKPFTTRELSAKVREALKA